MCQFKSMIVLKDRIFCPLNEDSHSDMLEALSIADDSCFPNFVRVEVVPKDGDVFNHEPSNWVVNVDQDFRPDWFSIEEYSPRIMEQMKEVFEKCFAVNDKSGKEFKDTKLYIKNSKVVVIRSSVVAWENSSVVAWENSSVVAWGNSSVVARENSSVVARGNSSVEAWENSSVVARGNSSVEAWENSSVEAWENSSVVAWENSSVVAWENSSVVARGNSSVVARGNSSVVAWENSSILVPVSKKINIKGVFDNAIIKDLSGSKPKIIVANDFEIEKYSKVDE